MITQYIMNVSLLLPFGRSWAFILIRQEGGQGRSLLTLTAHILLAISNYNWPKRFCPLLFVLVVSEKQTSWLNSKPFISYPNSFLCPDIAFKMIGIENPEVRGEILISSFGFHLCVRAPHFAATQRPNCLRLSRRVCEKPWRAARKRFIFQAVAVHPNFLLNLLEPTRTFSYGTGRDLTIFRLLDCGAWRFGGSVREAILELEMLRVWSPSMEILGCAMSISFTSPFTSTGLRPIFWYVFRTLWMYLLKNSGLCSKVSF